MNLPSKTSEKQDKSDKNQQLDSESPKKILKNINPLLQNFPMKLEKFLKKFLILHCSSFLIIFFFSIENDNKHLKDLVQKEFVNNQLLLSEMKSFRTLHDTLLNTNETLIKSNRTLQEKTHKLSTSLEFYRVYFYEYMDLLKNSRKIKRNTSLLPMKESKDYRRLHYDSIAKAPDFMLRDENKEVNVSILDEDKEKSKQKNLFSLLSKTKINENELEEFENVNYKNFLWNLAKELYTNPNVRSFYSVNKELLKKMEIHKFRLNDFKFIIKPKRAMSNPLNYISESLKNKLEKPPLKNKKNRITNQNHRLKKMLSKGYNPAINLGNGPFDVKSGLLPFFNLDVSKINNENMELSFDGKGNEEAFF